MIKVFPSIDTKVCIGYHQNNENNWGGIGNVIKY